MVTFTYNIHKVKELTKQLSCFHELHREMTVTKRQYDEDLVTVEELTNHVTTAERHTLKHDEEASTTNETSA